MIKTKLSTIKNTILITDFVTLLLLSSLKPVLSYNYTKDFDDFVELQGSINKKVELPKMFSENTKEMSLLLIKKK